MILNFTTLYVSGVVSDRKALLSYDNNFMIIVENEVASTNWKINFFKTSIFDSQNVTFTPEIYTKNFSTSCDINDIKLISPYDILVICSGLYFVGIDDNNGAYIDKKFDLQINCSGFSQKSNGNLNI